MHLADTAGWIGALVLVVAYATNSANRLPASGRTYQTMNLLGSVGLGTVAASHHTWPSFALNAVWLVVAFAALTRSGARRSPQPADTRK